MDKEALDHSLVRRLLDHIEAGTTDLADEVVEVPTDIYTSRRAPRDELDVLFHRGRSSCASPARCPRQGSYRTVDLWARRSS